MREFTETESVGSYTSAAIERGITSIDREGQITPKRKFFMPASIWQRADLQAVDATHCRIIGIDPAKIGYLQLATNRGECDAQHVKQIGEAIQSVATRFALLPEFASLRLV